MRTQCGSPYDVAMPNDITLAVSLDTIDELFVAPELDPLRGKFESQSGIDRLITLLPPKRGPESVAISIELSGDAVANAFTGTHVAAALDGYADQRIRHLRTDKKRLEKRGRTELVFGILFLAACLALSSTLAALDFGTPWLTQFYTEGLVIVGWIALWHPVDLLLFERWPLNREIGALERLRVASIAVGEQEPKSLA